MAEETKSAPARITKDQYYWILLLIFIITEIIFFYNMISYHRSSAIITQKKESEQSANFLQKIIKSYLENNNFSQIEYFINNWYEGHKDHLSDVTLTEDNGFVLVNIHNDQLQFKNTYTVDRDIDYLYDKKMKLQLIIDLENSLTNSNKFIIIVGIMILFISAAFAYMIFVTIKKDKYADNIKKRQEDLDDLLEELVQEVEKRKITEKELVNNQKLLQQAQEIASLGSWELNYEEGIINGSPEFFNIIKLPYKDQGNISLKEISKVTSNYIKILRESLDSKKTGSSFDEECYVIDQFTKKVLKIIRVIGKMSTDNNYSKNMLRGIIQDITDKKNKEIEIETANNDLKEMLHIVAHELQTPLVTMEGFSTLILENYKDKFDKQMSYYLERINTNALSMKKLINSILDISRLNTVKYPHEKFNTQLMITDLEQEIEIISDRKVIIALKTFPEIPEIYGDKQRIYLVFRNLVLNAINYGGKNVEIGYNPSKGFYVKDDGIGIKKDYIERIFIPGERLKENEVEGTGMGLTFCKKILEIHRGKIWAESKGKGQGATFFFKLPMLEEN